MCPRKPRQNTSQCSVVFRLVCIVQCVQYIHCEVLQVVRRSAVFRVPAAWWYVAGWPAQLSPNRQPHKAFLQDHLWQRSLKRDFNKYMAGSKAFLLEHLSYKLMITIPRHHTRHKMLHISIFIWVFLYSCIICCCICRYLRSWNHQLIIRAFGWKLGCWNGRPLIWEAPNDPSKTPRQPILCGVLYLYLYLYCVCICICFVFCIALVEHGAGYIPSVGIFGIQYLSHLDRERAQMHPISISWATSPLNW